MPRVTVIVPSYNHAQFVARAVESVLEQSFGDFEILVNDDASTDGTPDIVDRFSDPRIVLHRFTKNNGASASVNHALNRARGEYIAILNSDDYFLPGKLEKQVKFLDAKAEMGVVFGLPHFIDEDGREIPRDENPMRDLFVRTNLDRRKWLCRFFCIGNALCHPTALVRRSCYEQLGPYDPRLAQLPDFDLWIRIATRHELHILDEPVTAFRLLSGERNASAINPVGKCRHDFELSYVLRQYDRLDNSELSKIFESEFARIGQATGKSNPRILLGLLALELGQTAWAKSSYMAYGLDLLYRELEQENTDLSFSEFMKLTGSNDAYNLTAQSKMQQMAVELSTANGELSAVKEKLHRIRSSASWRLTSPFRKISSVTKKAIA